MKSIKDGIWKANFNLHVLHVLTLSDTPRRVSSTPFGAGDRCGMVNKSRDVTWNSAIRCISDDD